MLALSIRLMRRVRGQLEPLALQLLEQWALCFEVINPMSKILPQVLRQLVRVVQPLPRQGSPSVVVVCIVNLCSNAWPNAATKSLVGIKPKFQRQ